MTYHEALDYLTSLGRFGIKLGLERTEAVLHALGDPQDLFQGVHVAGTNGKGSVCAMLASVLQSAGYRVGLMPKPHLISYTERIQVDQRPIAEADFAAILTELQPIINKVASELGPPTEFEILTSAALYYFARAGIDLLVCEVGLGRRLDSTNVVVPVAAGVTSIGFDHWSISARRCTRSPTRRLSSTSSGSPRSPSSTVSSRSSKRRRKREPTMNASPTSSPLKPMPQVPILRVPFDDADLRFIQEGLAKILATGAMTMGAHTEAFETEFANLHAVPHAVATSNATTALEIILRSVGVEGGTVIVPANTFIATAFAAVHAGARVIFADCDPKTLCLDAEDVRKRLFKLQQEYLIELGDAVIATKSADGHIKLNQLLNTTARFIGV